MPGDQISSQGEKEGKGKTINLQASIYGTSFTPDIRVTLIRKYLEKSLRFIILIICLNVFTSAVNSWPLIDWWPREGWPSFVISLAINGIGFFIGCKALMKVREIRIS